MGWLDRALARYGYQKTQTVKDPPQWLRAEAADYKYALPSMEMPEAQADLMRRLSWVNIAVTIISQAAATQPLNVLKMTGEDTEDVPNHDFENLLRKPNPLMSRFEFLEATFAWRALTGNAYWWLNRTSEKDTPAELWIMDGKRVQPIPDEQMYIKGYLYDTGTAKIILEPWEVCHFKRFNPTNPYTGWSPIEALAMQSASDLEMTKWNLQLFGENGARLPGILAFADNIGQTEWERIKEDINAKASKRQIMMLRNVKAGGVNFIQAAASQKDMEFLASRQFTKEEIWTAFGPGLVAMLDKNATEANSKSGKATFTEFCLYPMLVSAGEKITNDIMPSYGEEFLAEFEDPRVTDRMLELQEQAAAEKVMTIDELRAQYYELPTIAEVSKEPEDKRGIMLIAQISPNTPIGEEPEPEPEPIPAQLMPGNILPEMVEEPETEQPEEEEPEEETQPEEVKAELMRWKRKAIRLWAEDKNAAAEFKSVVIPEDILSMVSLSIREAETESDIRSSFDKLKPIKISTDFSVLLSEMKRANDLLEAQLVKS